MFSPSALGGSVCLRCQIRAVTRRAPPLLAAAQIRGSRRRQYASDATTSRPEDASPVSEIREYGRETEQKLGESRQPQPAETSPPVVKEQTLPDPPRVALKNALDLPNGGVTEKDALLFETNTGLDQGPRADIELQESALTSEPNHGAKDRRDEGNTNQEQDLTAGQPQQKILSKKERVLAGRTCPHCRKVFPNRKNCDDHVKHGCASLKPPRDLKCPQCQVTFDTKGLLYRHWAKNLCTPKANPEKLAGREVGQKLEDNLSHAAAEFSGHQASDGSKHTIADDWSLPGRQDVHPLAAAADHEPGKSAEEYHVGDMELNIQTNPEINNAENGTVNTKATIPEDPARAWDKRLEKQAEEVWNDFRIRKIGQAVRTISGRKKEHRRGDMVLVEDASKLGVDSLGKAAEVIVLRDGRQWERRPAPVKDSSEEAMDSGLTIEDLLDEQDVLSLDDVVKNIHGLNPQRQIVSAREFKSLFNTLLSGFTILQLEKYVVWHREQPVLEMIKNEVFGENESLSEESTIPEDVVPKRREYAWMTEQAHWTPYVDGAVEEAQYPLAGYVMKSMPPKQRLVVQLMRECWEISVQELLDGNGHVDIRVRDLEFKLLTRKYNNVIYYQYPVAQLIMNVPVGTQRWLERISRLFLKEGQQIQVRRSSNLVRITAPKPVAETCVHELGETLQKIKTETLKLDQVPKQRLDAGILEELGRITNSVVQFGPGREAVREALSLRLTIRLAHSLTSKYRFMLPGSISGTRSHNPLSKIKQTWFSAYF